MFKAFDVSPKGSKQSKAGFGVSDDFLICYHIIQKMYAANTLFFNKFFSLQLGKLSLCMLCLLLSLASITWRVFFLIILLLCASERQAHIYIYITASVF